MANLSNINNKFIVTDGGNVLIGQTNNSSGILQIKDTQTSSFNDGLAITRNNAAQTGYINMVGGAFNFNSPGLSYKFRNNGTQTLELDSSGNASFAGKISSVKELVNINSANGIRSAGLESDSTGNIWLGTGTTAATINFVTGNSTNGTPSTNGVKRLTTNREGTDVYASYASNTFPFRIGYLNGSTYTPTFVVEDTGNVGIGVIDPGARLEVKAADTAATTDYATKVIKAVAPLVGGYTGTKIISLLGGFDGAIHAVDLGYGYDGTGYNLMLSTNDNTTGDPIERIRINNSGNVSISGDGIQIDRPNVGGGKPYVFWKSGGTTQASIYGASSGAGLRIFLSGGRADFDNSISFTGIVQQNAQSVVLSNSAYQNAAAVQAYATNTANVYPGYGFHKASSLGGFLYATSRTELRYRGDGGTDKVLLMADSDYEEGTWTPVIAHNDGTGVVPIGSNHGARYVKVGDLVYISCYLTGINPNGNAGGSGNYYGIRGMPFTPENYGAWQIVYASSGITAYGGYSSTASLYFMTNGTNGQRSQVHVNGAQVNAWGSSLTMMLNCVYNING